ncbi:MAG: ABC transporter permease, partial [Bdellovibrionales bacterium]|nr:ABC transporter permease [Bdellovibrionales bacterium]
LVFLLLHAVPGDPVDLMLGESALPSNRDALRAELRLDRPLPEQYALFWKHAVTGDLGRSIVLKKPVAALIAERLPATAALAALALALAVAVGIPLGVLSAALRESWIDRALLLLSTAAFSIPNFWLGPLLVLFFSVRLGWFPVSEMAGPASFVLPALTLSISMAAVLLRMTRTSMLGVLSQAYITAAEAKGLGRAALWFRHALKNALIPVISVLGLQLGSLLGGVVITETIFDWPGLGELLYRGIQGRDYPLVQSCVLLIACAYVAVNTVTDAAYRLADPRVEAK